MNLASYWPSRDNVIDCIRTEAEELTDHLLISVHQPMQLRKSTVSRHSAPKGEAAVQMVTEHDLLEHLRAVNRPIPLIGNAGAGKSHLVRWVHAQLSLDVEAKQHWHVVRIPKNASLRQVLTKLLDGLKGEQFDQARDRINEVSSSLETDKIAKLFVAFTQFALEQIEKDIRKGPKPVDREDANKLKQQVLMAGKLRDLLDDALIGNHLIQQGMPIYNLAHRLVSTHQSYEDIDSSQYEISQSHLDFDYDIENLGKAARDAINSLQLYTNPERMQASITLLNQAVNKSTQDIFNKLFQFNNGNFQDLFKDIRRALKQQDKILTVLVEDMAAISAIEDVLIDSLLEEDIYEGNSELCPLKSIVAVTENYPGYIKRGATLVSRSGFEWMIDTDGHNQGYDRVVEFCSRYLNAARYGKQSIAQLWKNTGGFTTLPVWGEQRPLEGEALDTLEAFGRCDSNIPLFPYNRAALIKLAKTYCESQGRIEFNPRKIINTLLLNVLRDHHADFTLGRFPSVNFANEVSTEGAGGVISEINRLGLSLEARIRTQKFALIWGQGRNLTELKTTVNNLQARVFGLPEIYGDGPNAPMPDVGNKPVSPKKSPDDAQVDPTPEFDQSLIDLEHCIDDWFSRKARLPSETANDLRKQLFEMLCQYSHLECYGVDVTQQWRRFDSNLQPTDKKAQSLFELTMKVRGNFLLISIPESGNNPTGSFIDFCHGEELTDTVEAAELKRTVLAILRYQHHNSEKREKKGWDYPEGFEDFSYYTSFANAWVHKQIPKLIARVRENTFEFMAQQLAYAEALGLGDVGSPKSALPVLLKSSTHLRAELGQAVNEELDVFREELLASWDDMRSEWKKRVVTDYVAIDISEFKTAFSKAKKNKRAILTASQRKQFKLAFSQIKPSLDLIAESLSDFENVEDVKDGLQSMLDVYKEVHKLAVYPPSDKVSALATVTKYVKAQMETPFWPLVKDIIKLADPNVDPSTTFKLINRLDKDALESWTRVIRDWNIISDFALPKLESENQAAGVNKVLELDNNIQSKFDNLSASLIALMVEECANEY
ncbi:TPA: ATP-binding protein [Vibrio parahaemolyticus]|nr:ATP-binding protein [Vibrio parahaemolyticus]MDF4873603.1 protein DpdH [Vibrio parahaemolyticus]HCG8583602.1 ATP-binding protein [Vibrio parahaemolyticus]HCG9752872.1 ATP-binding protein [Vibrio parahaemolyticus]HCH1656967.1 ATP-binding protein [Vibrio parahaemolyticus]